MGRWSQRRRGGGGPSILNQMIEAVIEDSTSASLYFKLPVTPAQLTPANFHCDPSGEVGVSSIQLDPNSVTMLFAGTILTDIECTHEPPAPGFAVPTTVELG